MALRKFTSFSPSHLEFESLHYLIPNILDDMVLHVKVKHSSIFLNIELRKSRTRKSDVNLQVYS